MRTKLCKRCGEPAQQYGGVGAFSVQCKECNDASNVKKRAASARRRANGIYPPSRPDPSTKCRSSASNDRKDPVRTKLVLSLEPGASYEDSLLHLRAALISNRGRKIYVNQCGDARQVCAVLKHEGYKFTPIYRASFYT